MIVYTNLKNLKELKIYLNKFQGNIDLIMLDGKDRDDTYFINELTSCIGKIASLERIMVTASKDYIATMIAAIIYKDYISNSDCICYLFEPSIMSKITKELNTLYQVKPSEQLFALSKRYEFFWSQAFGITAEIKDNVNEGKRKFPTSFRQEVIQFYLHHPDVPKKDIAEKFNVPYPTLYTWIRQYKERADGNTIRTKQSVLEPVTPDQTQFEDGIRFFSSPELYLCIKDILSDNGLINSPDIYVWNLEKIISDSGTLTEKEFHNILMNYALFFSAECESDLYQFAKEYYKNNIELIPEGISF